MKTLHRRCRIFLIFLIAAAAFCVAVAAKKKPPAHPVNLNTATGAQLEEVPGIGPSTSEKILQMRKSYGTFKSVDDLLAIKGMGPKRLDKMRKYLTVGKAQPAHPTTQKPQAASASPPVKVLTTKPTAAQPTTSEDEEP